MCVWLYTYSYRLAVALKVKNPNVIQSSYENRIVLWDSFLTLAKEIKLISNSINTRQVNKLMICSRGKSSTNLLSGSKLNNSPRFD